MFCQDKQLFCITNFGQLPPGQASSAAKFQRLDGIISVYVVFFQPDYNYRGMVKAAIPHLEILDDEPLTEVPSGPQIMPSVFEDDWKLIDELLQTDILQDSEDSLEVNGQSQGAILLSHIRIMMYLS